MSAGPTTDAGQLGAECTSRPAKVVRSAAYGSVFKRFFFACFVDLREGDGQRRSERRRLLQIAQNAALCLFGLEL